MKKQIIKVSLVQNAKLMAALYLVLSIPLVLLMMLAASFDPNGGFPMWMLIVLPVMYCAMGFVFTLFGAWVYNLVAARVGGFEFTTAEVSRD